MTSDFEARKQRVLEILGALNKTVYAAFNEVMALPNSTAYAYAIVERGPRRISCPVYKTWKEEICRVQGILDKYNGKILVEEALLEKYLRNAEAGREMPRTEVNVKIILPGQDKLAELKELLG